MTFGNITYNLVRASPVMMLSSLDERRVEKMFYCLVLLRGISQVAEPFTLYDLLLFVLVMTGIKSLNYDLSIANVSIGKASLTQASTIKGNDSGKLQLPITFRPKDFGGAVWDMIRGKGTGYAMTGSLEVGTPFGPMHLPFDKSSRTTLKGKDAEDV